jgi:predicted nucleotidyltransferase
MHRYAGASAWFGLAGGDESGRFETWLLGRWSAGDAAGQMIEFGVGRECRVVCSRWGYGWCMMQAEVIGEIGRRLNDIAPHGSRILLFGSRARGDADPYPDYDVLVIEPVVENAAEESVRLRRSLDGLGAPIDVLVCGAAIACSRAAVRGTLVERALREGHDLTSA